MSLNTSGLVSRLAPNSEALISFGPTNMPAMARVNTYPSESRCLNVGAAKEIFDQFDFDGVTPSLTCLFRHHLSAVAV